MVDISLLVIFIPTFFIVSVTPGMCMTLSMTLGIAIGYKKTLWMMIGELVGVGTIAVLSVIGVATVMLKYPNIFFVLKMIGGSYLVYLGVNMWLSKGKMAINLNKDKLVLSRKELIYQGFVAAIANPKGWAFFISLLPPFLNPNYPIFSQLAILIMIILTIEFICLNLYSIGGNVLRHFLEKRNNVEILNRVSGSMMIGIAIWLVLG